MLLVLDHSDEQICMAGLNSSLLVSKGKTRRRGLKDSSNSSHSSICSSPGSDTDTSESPPTGGDLDKDFLSSGASASSSSATAMMSTSSALVDIAICFFSKKQVQMAAIVSLAVSLVFLIMTQKFPQGTQLRAAAATTTTSSSTSRTTTATTAMMMHNQALVQTVVSGTPETAMLLAELPGSKHQHHAIPNILIFTHRYNLLQVDVNDLKVKNNAERKELAALQRNVRHSIAMHPDARVRFLTDDDCVQSIRAVLGYDTPLVEYFNNEKVGMFKADLCRGAALVETGGLYFDVDLGVRMTMWDVLRPNTTFATVRVHSAFRDPEAFFQAFVGSTAGNSILKRYVQLFLEYYEGRLGDIHGLLGVLFLKRAFDEILEEERLAADNSNAAAADNNNQNGLVAVAASSTPSTTTNLGATEIWQEVMYGPKLAKSWPQQVPPPTWGRRGICKFVVVSGSSRAQKSSSSYKVPFYSRIEGSRLCPTSLWDAFWDGLW